jgi:1-acyl-sn-glycerol-3-phosphate acyltransferase
MLPVLRSLLFTFAITLLTLVMGVVMIPLLLLPREKLWGYGKAWSWTVLWLLRHTVGISYKIIDPHNILPTLKTPVIFASRHESAFEAIAYVCLLPRSVSIIKKELLRIPFYGWYCKKIGSIALDRQGGMRSLKALLAGAEQAMQRGHSLIIFPEGTRVAPHTTVPLKGGIAALYVHCNMPVVPISVNSGQFWAKNRFVKQQGVVIISIQQQIDAGLPRHEFMETLQHKFIDGVNASPALQHDKRA